MSIIDILDTVFIGPLRLLFDVVFTMSYYITGSAGISIFVLSMIINILLLPMYNRADQIQREENEIQSRTKPYTDHIKKVFKGDEQYMILNTYYRQNGYKPVYALRSSISLLLQIPFFIAAYSYLSNLQVLQNASFGPIRDFSLPDGLLGGINLLPILMTVINIISSLIYTKGQPLKKNIQLYIIALFFLVFLYNRPSGLVFYWVLNNLFSLIKNIVAGIDINKKTLAICCSAASIISILLIIVLHPLSSLTLTIVAVGILLLFNLPMIICLLEEKGLFKNAEIQYEKNGTFLFGCILLCTVIGMYIPSSVISSSPTEFVSSVSLRNPLHYMAKCFLMAFGVFIIWLNIYYYLLNKRFRKPIEIICLSLSIFTLVSYLFFGTNLGIISSTLVYKDGLQFSMTEIIMNLLVLGMIFYVAFLLYKKKKVLYRLISILIVSLLVLSSFNIVRINNDAKKQIDSLSQLSEQIEDFEIPFSREGKNVVLIMLDMAISSYFPFLLEEKPVLQEQYAGFTYYPNCLSYGGHTLYGAPALFGGYEYTPLNMNRRSDEKLVDKHNESLKVLPVLFDNSGFDVTVCDPPLAGYQWTPDLSIYDEYDDIKKYLTMGAFKLDEFSDLTDMDVLDRNLFCFSFMKTMPLLIQGKLYDYGYYNDIDSFLYHSSIKEDFVSSYAVLRNFIDRTKIYDDDQDHYFMISNETTHEPDTLKEPEYVPSRIVDNRAYDEEHRIRKSIEGKEIELKIGQQGYYMTEMASIQEIGEWLDYLRENDVYDNTRIVIVSDHGSNISQFSELLLDKNDKYADILFYNPLLLVKDFNSKEFKIDYSFMTNADVPSILTEKIIKEPVNPFTGNKISSEEKNDPEQYVCANNDVDFNWGNVFGKSRWYSVHDNIFDLNNWKEYKEGIE